MKLIDLSYKHSQVEEEKDLSKSLLDQIEGVGKRRKELY